MIKGTNGSNVSSISSVIGKVILGASTVVTGIYLIRRIFTHTCKKKKCSDTNICYHVTLWEVKHYRTDIQSA